MEIRTHKCGVQNGWAVFAQWMGEERAVFWSYNIFACIAWRKEMQDA